MPSPGTRNFIGPLTPAQRRRRERSRETFRVADEIAYARNITMREAFEAVKAERFERMFPSYVWRGQGTGEFP